MNTDRPFTFRHYAAALLLGGAFLMPAASMAMDESTSGHKSSMSSKDMSAMADQKKSSITKNKDHDSTRGMTDSGGLPLKMKQSQDYRQRNEMMEKDRHSSEFKRP